VLTGFESLDNTTARPFNPDIDKYKPTSVNGQPASSYELALTTADFMFPQIWRTNLAVDQRLPFGVFGTLEYMYNKDINGVYYINANLPAAQSSFAGADNRGRWTVDQCPTISGTQANRLPGNCKITNAIVLKNQNVGKSWNVAASLEKPFSSGLYVKLGYMYGESKNTVDPGSIAFGSWNNNQHAGDPNNPGLGYSINSPGHRFFTAATYRAEFLSFGATTVSFFLDRRTNGNASYVFSGDLNGDGGTSNDLLYIPRDVSEMNFQEYTAGGRKYTAAEQATAWDAYIEQDPYLSEHRGEYAQRGAFFLPMVQWVDFGIAQEIFRNVRGQRNSIEVRADFLNFLNFLNSDWGVGQRMVTNSPLVVPSGAPADAQGRAQYRLRTITSGGDMISKTFESTAGIGDVYRIQFSLRYRFN
jgi:hypothetical protein